MGRHAKIATLTGVERACALAAVLAGAALSVAGCGRQRLAVAASRAEVSAASPAVRGSENGLELAWWVVTPRAGGIVSELREWIDEPVPADAAALKAWSANGLRVVSIPVEKLETLRGRLPIVGAIQRQWLGQAPLWTDAVRGPYWAGGATVGLDTGPLRLGPGRLRLLTRCWTVPVPSAPPPAPDGARGAPPGSEGQGVRAALHIELVLQHQEAGAAAERDPFSLPKPSAGREDEGLVFRRLLLTLEAPPGRAYLIVPETPGVSWRPDNAGQETVQPEAPRAPEAASSTPPVGRIARSAGGEHEPAARPGGIEPAGPPAPMLMSLGQAMLTSVGARGPRPIETSEPSRAIIILVPRVPSEFRLLR